jgi:hypothetical protein
MGRGRRISVSARCVLAVSSCRQMHRYITPEMFASLDDACDKVVGQIVKMIDHADRWIVKPRRNTRND